MKKFILVFVVFVCSFLGIAVAGQAWEPEEVALAIEGRKLLNEQKAGFTVRKECVTSEETGIETCTRKVDQFDVLLAVKAGDSPMTTIRVSGRSCVSKTAGFKTGCPVGWGINTRYVVRAPQEYVVYAAKRVVGVASGLKEVVYTPYAASFNTKIVQLYGRLHMARVIRDAYQDLANRSVRSLTNKDEYVHARVPQDVIENLVVVEHMDHSRLGKTPTEDLVNEVYVTIAMNQDLAYNYTRSQAQATGLTQVIPSTYKGLKRLYPNAGLISEFGTGMTEHRNAIKAAVLLADHDLGIIRKDSVRTALLEVQNRDKYRDFIAASYNGGPSRAMGLLLNGKDLMRDNGNSENQMYVHKMREVAATPLQVAAQTLF